MELDFTGRSGDYVVLGDNADVLPKLPDQSFQLIYIDPPFNTGKVQQRLTLRTHRSENGDRVGFGGRSYATAETGRKAYRDSFDDYLSFIGPRLEEARRLLTDDGTLYFHIDYRCLGAQHPRSTTSPSGALLAHCLILSHRSRSLSKLVFFAPSNNSKTVLARPTSTSRPKKQPAQRYERPRCRRLPLRRVGH